MALVTAGAVSAAAASPPAPPGPATSWGGLTARGSARIPARAWLDDPRRSGPALAIGNGRSYGDSALIDDGTLIDTRDLARIESFDAASGVLVAEPGLLLGDLLPRIVPQGWFVPVTPGTRFVTLGGALANDVHGKNHHARGSFGEHVLWLELARSDGQRLRCSPCENAALFRATIGGMGLTGLVTKLALQLITVPGPALRQDTLPFPSLDAWFEMAEASDASHEYTVAWIDSLARGRSLGRGVLFRANHAAGEAPAPGAARLAMPFTPPVPLIGRPTLTAFNALYRLGNRRRDGALVHYQPFFYPLDGVRDWNRAYGPKGLRQFQCVVPFEGARRVVRALLEATHQAGEASFLTVLKRFGERPAAGMLSFPRGGVTLTLDFANRGAATEALLARLDAITIEAGGRINPYKDARMPRAAFEASFPQWRAFAAYVDPGFSSNFWRRVTG